MALLYADVAVTGRGAEAVFSQIEKAFGEFGIEAATRRAQPMPTGTTELPLAVLVTVLLAPFFNALVSKAGDDAYAALKMLVRSMVTVEEDEVPAEAVGASGGGRSEVEFHDVEAPIRFTIDLRLPDIALRRLAEIDWAELSQITPTWQKYVKLHWDPEDEEWWIALFNRRAPLAVAIIDVGETDFQARVIEADKPVLVHFWAPWASPCRLVASHLAELAEARDDLQIAKLNVDDNPHLTEIYPVMAIPTLLLFKHGQVVHTIVGAQPKSRMVHEIESALAA